MWLVRRADSSSLDARMAWITPGVSARLGGMARASWNGVVLAESDRCQVVEGNVYFPPEAVRQDVLGSSTTTTVCGWKGTANYYDVVVGDAVNRDAAWYYRDPKPEAAHIKGYVAFWHGVRVER
jgi:uncharacterized protein (DUF427 family)